jgi:hypothetical protein
MREKVAAVDVLAGVDEIARAEPGDAGRLRAALWRDVLDSIATWGDTESRTIAALALRAAEREEAGDGRNDGRRRG